jgi:hypothetical protein
MFSKNSSARSFIALNAIDREALGHSDIGGGGVPGELLPLLEAFSQSPDMLGDASNLTMIMVMIMMIIMVMMMMMMVMMLMIIILIMIIMVRMIYIYIYIYIYM